MVMGLVGVCGAADVADLRTAHAHLLRAAAGAAHHGFAHRHHCVRLYVFAPPEVEVSVAVPPGEEELADLVVIPCSDLHAGGEDERLPFYLSRLLQDL